MTIAGPDRRARKVLGLRTSNTIAFDGITALVGIGEACGIATDDAAKPDTEINRMDAFGMRGFDFFRTSSMGRIGTAG